MSKGGKGGGSQPQAVNPYALASAQTGSNIATAEQQARLNNANVNSPFGSSWWQGAGTDPNTGLPTSYTLNQNLSPELQQLFGQQTGLASYLAGTGAPGAAAAGAGLTGQGANLIGQGVGAAGQINPSLAAYLAGTASPVSLTPESFRTSVTGGAGGQPIPQAVTGVPSLPTQTTATTGAAGQPIGQVQTGVAGAGQGIQGAVGPAGPIQANLSPEDFGTQIKQAQDAAYKSQTQYLDPQFNQQEESLRQRLADQGIQEGSDAHTRAMGDFNRQKQMAYQSAQSSAVAAGNQQQQALFSQQLQSGQFANQAQAQQYVQKLQDAGFINASQAQAFGQQIQAGQFANLAQGQTFGQGVNLAQLYNQANQQQFAQNLAGGQFTNQAQQQLFGQGVNLADLYNQAQLGAAGTTNQAAQLGLQRAMAQQQAPITAMQALLQGGGGVFGQGLAGLQSALPAINAAPTWPLSIPTMGGTPTTVTPTNYAATQQAATGANQLSYNAGQQNLSNMLGFGNLGSQILTGQSLGGLFGSGGGLFGLLGGGAGAGAGAGAAASTLGGGLTEALFGALL